MEDHVGNFRYFQEQFNNLRTYDEQVREAIADLKERSQTGTLQEYFEPFTSLLNDGWLEEELAVSLFLGGLRDEVRNSVGILKPRTLADAHALAWLQEFFLPASNLNKSDASKSLESIEAEKETSEKFPWEPIQKEATDEAKASSQYVSELEDHFSTPHLATSQLFPENRFQEAVKSVTISTPVEEYRQDDDCIMIVEGQVESVNCKQENQVEQGSSEIATSSKDPLPELRDLNQTTFSMEFEQHDEEYVSAEVELSDMPKEEVPKVIQFCEQYQVPNLSYSGAMLFEGHSLSSTDGVCIDMSLMKRIKAIHVKDVEVVVEQGIGWMELNEDLESYGLFFPHDPGPDASFEASDLLNQRVVVTNSLFNMDGDFASLLESASFQMKHGYALVVDDTHRPLVYGKNGCGVAEAYNGKIDIDISVGILSKVVVCQGGITCTIRGKQMTLSVGWPFIFFIKASAPLADVAHAIGIIARKEAWSRRKKKVQEFQNLMGAVSAPQRNGKEAIVLATPAKKLMKALTVGANVRKIWQLGIGFNSVEKVIVTPKQYDDEHFKPLEEARMQLWGRCQTERKGWESKMSALLNEINSLQKSIAMHQKNFWFVFFLKLCSSLGRYRGFKFKLVTFGSQKLECSGPRTMDMETSPSGSHVIKAAFHISLTDAADGNYPRSSPDGGSSSSDELIELYYSSSFNGSANSEHVNINVIIKTDDLTAMKFAAMKCAEFVNDTISLANSLYHQALEVLMSTHSFLRDYQADVVNQSYFLHFLYQVERANAGNAKLNPLRSFKLVSKCPEVIGNSQMGELCMCHKVFHGELDMKIFEKLINM